MSNQRLLLVSLDVLALIDTQGIAFKPGAVFSKGALFLQGSELVSQPFNVELDHTGSLLLSLPAFRKNPLCLPAETILSTEERPHYARRWMTLYVLTLHSIFTFPCDNGAAYHSCFLAYARTMIGFCFTL